jgi:predicted N-acyltransferase
MDSIDAFGAARWDSVAGRHLALHSAWQRVLERSARGYRPRYVGVEDASGLVAVAAAPLWDESPVRRALKSLCFAAWAPYSASAPGLCFAEGAAAEVQAAAVDAIRAYALRGLRPLVSVVAGEETGGPTLDRLGFAPVGLPPDTVLDLTWPTFGAYTQALGSKARNELRRTRRIAETAGVVVQEHASARGMEEALFACMRETFSSHGDQVPSRDSLFRDVEDIYGENAMWLTSHVGGKLAGFLLVIHHGDEVVTPFAGFHYALSRASQTYFVLLEETIRHAFRVGARRAHLGIGNYQIKERLGFRRAPRALYLDASSRALRPVARVAHAMARRAYQPSEKS